MVSAAPANGADGKTEVFLGQHKAATTNRQHGQGQEDARRETCSSQQQEGHQICCQQMIGGAMG